MAKGEVKKAEEEAKAAMLHERQTPRGLLTHAREFQSTAELIAECVGVDDTIGALREIRCHNPFSYLCGHAIELAMKSALLASGRSHAELKKTGHSLQACLDQMREIFPSHAETYDAHADMVALLNSGYESKEFEYRLTGAKPVPKAKDLLQTVDAFCEVTEMTLAG